MDYRFQIVGTIPILIVGVIVARAVASFLLNLLERKNFDITLAEFTAAAVKGTILGFAIIIALGKLGITIAPFVAALAAMAFGASFAIQGRLSNYGAGPSIIIARRVVVKRSQLRARLLKSLFRIVPRQDGRVSSLSLSLPPNSIHRVLWSSCCSGSRFIVNWSLF